MTRKVTSRPMLGAMPRGKEATVKPAVEIGSRFFRPSWLPTMLKSE